MVVFSAGGISFYELVRITIIRQIDTDLVTDSRIIEEQMHYYDSIPNFMSIFGHQIEVTLYDTRIKPSQSIMDTVIADSVSDSSAEYRHLVVNGNISGGKGYRIDIYKSLEETHKLIMDLFIVICLAFITLSMVLIAVNYLISRKLWVPFYQTLNKIRNFNINENLQLNLTNTGIREFDMLNRVLSSMSEKIRTDYFNLKEFTEDASHEIQTPLSIIKSKLELLFQSEQLSDKQAENIRAIYEATTRLSKLNHSLLLISKIQNLQYANTGQVDLANLISKFLLHFKEITEQKNIRIEEHYHSAKTLKMNPDLAEILTSNLLGNAIKHNIENGWISIDLSDNELVISNSGHPLNSDPGELFKRFRKGNISSDSSGLGLSIVNKIVSLYDMKAEYSVSGNIHTFKIDFNKS